MDLWLKHCICLSVFTYESTSKLTFVKHFVCTKLLFKSCVDVVSIFIIECSKCAGDYEARKFGFT